LRNLAKKGGIVAGMVFGNSLHKRSDGKKSEMEVEVNLKRQAQNYSYFIKWALYLFFI
jgi:hypothetical protein